ncbi:MAG: hypothetical protein ACKOT0_00370 [bacterium]
MFIKGCLSFAGSACLLTGGFTATAMGAEGPGLPSTLMEAEPNFRLGQSPSKSSAAMNRKTIPCHKAKIGAVLGVKLRYSGPGVVISWSRPGVDAKTRLNVYRIEFYNYASGLWEQYVQLPARRTAYTITPDASPLPRNAALQLRVYGGGETWNAKTERWEGAIGCKSNAPTSYKISYPDGTTRITPETPDEALDKCVNPANQDLTVTVGVKGTEGYYKLLIVLEDIVDSRDARPRPFVVPALAVLGAVLGIKEGAEAVNDMNQGRVQYVDCVNAIKG